MRKVELLAPAGNYETMLGAFNAGADAVYLGGQGFGARAFADNFTNEEVVRAIKYAHLQGKKIYLTVNTLLKENEIEAFKEFFAPFAYAGLDGAIIQDFGIFKIIRESFPWVELHVSTQMTITGVGGANVLKELGAKRIVPARELSLKEIEDIHNNCKFDNGESIEIEAFIHGAMCYCYSGACLFSSMVGERSGNRGRCAQPCRLPYKKNGRECYPLSLKDMCMVDRIPELIEAGIDSFKIEGRMKKPEYAAGVTSVYRKYIDDYYNSVEKNTEFGTESHNKTASSQDKKVLSSLYLRSEIGEGYYFRHNGPEMVTIDNPSYNGSDEKVLDDVRNKYLTGEKKVKISLKGSFRIDNAAEIVLRVCDNERTDCGTEISCKGEIVQAALKKPMSEDDLAKQLSKFGNTYFELVDIDLDIDENGIFIANKALNELRRNASDKLLSELMHKHGYKDEFSVSEIEKPVLDENEVDEYSNSGNTKLAVSVMNLNQLKKVLDHLNYSDSLYRLYIDSRIILQNFDLNLTDKSFEAYVALPYLLRNEAFINGHDEIREILKKAEELKFDGVLVRNTEELFVIREYGYKGSVVLDYGLYMWNHEAYSLYKELIGDYSFSGFNLPLELNFHEVNELLNSLYKAECGNGQLCPEAGYMVYGRVPMMISAGCIKNTLESCSGKRGMLTSYGETEITDRTGRTLPITYDCRHCTNIIWNSVPVSLFKKVKKLKKFEKNHNVIFRIDFTTEDENSISDILDAYKAILCDNNGKDINRYEKLLSEVDYTTGHFERSAD